MTDTDNLGGIPADSAPEHPKHAALIRALIVNAGDMASMFSDIDRLKKGEYMRAWHSFPTTREDLRDTLKEIGLGGEKPDYIINSYHTDIPGLLNCLHTGMYIDELNYLAVKLAAMDGFSLEKFSAALEYSVFREGLADIINTAENLDCFDLQPAYSLDQYGEFLAEMSRDEHADALARLENTNEEGICALPSYIDHLEKHFDAEAYARNVVQKEGGRFTEHGYLTKEKALKEIYTGINDIPAEYRVSFPPEPRERPSALDKLAAAKDAVARADAEKPAVDWAAKSPGAEL